MRNRSAETHILYRFFADDELLYVGITNNPRNRLKAHQADKTWFSQVTRSTMQHFATREALMEAEIKAIQAEKPRYNVTYADGATAQPIKVRERGQAQSVFGADANKFPQPGDEPEDLSFLRQPRLTMPMPCPACFAPQCCYRPCDEYGSPVGDQVHCGWCQTTWTVDEWRSLVGFNL